MSINNMLDLAFKTPLYAELYKSRGIVRSDIKGEDDLWKLPTVSKANLVKDFTKAIGKPEDVFKYHTSSGTSGTPTVVAFTQNDWDIYVKQNAKCLQLIGSTKKDMFYNATPYGMFFAGLVLHDAAIRMGAKIIPAGNLSTINAHFNLIELFNPTVFIGIPQYLLKMGNVYADLGKDPRDLSFKKAYCLGEPLPNKKRELISMILRYFADMACQRLVQVQNVAKSEVFTGQPRMYLSKCLTSNMEKGSLLIQRSRKQVHLLYDLDPGI